jgi:hypothetical protein
LVKCDEALDHRDGVGAPIRGSNTRLNIRSRQSSSSPRNYLRLDRAAAKTLNSPRKPIMALAYRAPWPFGAKAPRTRPREQKQTQPSAA